MKMRRKIDRDQSPIRVRVPKASYPILVQEGLLAETGEVLQKLFFKRKPFILADTTVWKLWGKQLLESLDAPRPPVILVPSGERYKRMATVEKIAQQLSEQGAERSSLLIVFGGGVVGDIGGFVASVFLRGIEYVHIPTTLLAQVDSSIGGKTGVNLAAGKNLVGTFCQPRMVLMDPLLLRTLPRRELRAGLFEAIKCAVIGDSKLFEILTAKRSRILSGEPAALLPVIRACATLKSRVVSLDEKEGNLRRILNFGHTLGHALEAATRYRRFLHGEAVAWGMLGATKLAVQSGQLATPAGDQIRSLIVSYGPVPSLGRLDLAAVCRHLSSDKKVRSGKVHFVLPCRIGKVRIVSGISEQQIRSVLKNLTEVNPFGRMPRNHVQVPAGKQ